MARLGGSDRFTRWAEREQEAGGRLPVESTRAARDAVMGDNAQKTLETEDSAVQDFL